MSPIAPRIVGRDCPHCGNSGKKIGEKEGVALRECCALLLAWAWEDEASYEAQYRDAFLYHVTEQQANGQLPYWERDSEHLRAASARLTILTTLFPDSLFDRMMDVGAGTGAFVETARIYFHYIAEGVEPSATMTQIARQQGRRSVRTGTWRDVRGGYSLITLWDVFEHLTRPLPALLHLRRSLVNGGRLVIEMPEWNGPQQRAAGLSWKHIRVRQHICLYSRSAAEALFAEAGFEVDAFWRPCGGLVGKAAWALRANP
jgi:SAM-dependent methyltransferase